MVRGWLCGGLLWMLGTLPGLPSPVMATESPRIEARAEPSNPFLQQQVRYTLRLYRDSHLQQGHFVEPAIAGAILLPLASPPPRQVEEQGHRYELLEQRYLLFPQQSGTLHLPAPVFSSRTLFIQGQPLTLEVKPPPAGTAVENWLVTPELRITEQWQTPTAPWRTGDHLQRTITLQAEALTGAQLPRIQPPVVDGMQIQHLGSDIEDAVQAGRLTGRRHEQFLYVPQRAGRFSISPLDIPWFNSTTQQQAWSRLPGRQLSVIESTRAGSITDPAVTGALPAPDTATSSAATSSAGGIPLTLIAGLLAGALGLLLLRRFTSMKSVRQKTASAWWEIRLISTCRKPTAATLLQLLREWFRSRDDAAAPFSLIALANQCNDPAIKFALLQLDQALYAGNGETFPLRRHLPALRKLLRSPSAESSRRRPDPLPPLWQ